MTGKCNGKQEFNIENKTTRREQINVTKTKK